MKKTREFNFAKSRPVPTGEVEAARKAIAEKLGIKRASRGRPSEKRNTLTLSGSLNKKLENPKYRVEFERRYRIFKLEVQILLAMEDKDWGYEDLAKATGIHRQNIWRDLKNGGLHKASLDRVSRYAEALGLHVHHFLMSSKEEKKILPILRKQLAYAA